jgi:hypothetical protein
MTGRSRRSAVKLICGALIGTVFAHRGAERTAAAMCRPNGQRSERNRQCCSDECHQDVCRRDRPED